MIRHVPVNVLATPSASRPRKPCCSAINLTNDKPPAYTKQEDEVTNQEPRRSAPDPASDSGSCSMSLLCLYCSNRRSEMSLSLRRRLSQTATDAETGYGEPVRLNPFPRKTICFSDLSLRYNLDVWNTIFCMRYLNLSESRSWPDCPLNACSFDRISEHAQMSCMLLRLSLVSHGYHVLRKLIRWPKQWPEFF